MNGWITPALEYFECPTPIQVLCTEQLVNLLPRFIHFASGVDERVIADMLIDAGCVQVWSARDRLNFRGQPTALRAAWQKCLEITGDDVLAFEIVTSSSEPSPASQPRFPSPHQ